VRNPNLGVETFVLESHEEHTCHFARQWTASRLQFSKKIGQSFTHTLLKVSNGCKRRPVLVFLRNLRVRLLYCVRAQN
jgi:hypothetical protein